jgi:U3 small nucleolar ribonucleoprotein protein IMP4
LFNVVIGESDDSHHVFAKTSHKDVQLSEVGPRFEAKPYEIRQGTLDQKEADIEWLYRPFMRTAKKKNQL